MKFKLPLAAKSLVRKQVAGAIVGLAAIAGGWGGGAAADPAQDTVAKLNDLSRQAEQLTESMRSAQLDLDKKLQLQREADARHAGDMAALEAAEARLAARQGAVDRLAAAVYMGGQTDGLNAILTATSPKSLIDELAIQRVVATEAATQLRTFRQAAHEAQAIESASAASAADAKAAADAAAAVQTDLRNKRAELRTQVAFMRASYAMLPHTQQAALITPSPSVIAALGLAPPVPLVGMSGLVPNARSLVQYIATTYPGVQSIGGVRSDPLPDHPSGHAIDIMIGSDMSLGDAINADVQSQSGRFGVQYTMWRVANHFNHVHVTVS